MSSNVLYMWLILKYKRMKNKQYHTQKSLFTFFFIIGLFALFSCEQKKANFAPITYYKNITPGVNQAFAVQALGSNTFSLLGIEQKTKYDFGTLKQKRIKFISQDSVSYDNVFVPADKIAFPSNLQINKDNSSVFLALRSDKKIVVYHFDKDGKYTVEHILAGFDNQVPLSVIDYDAGYLLLTNDTLDKTLNTKIFLIKASTDFQQLSILDSFSYNAEPFSTIESKNLFSTYYFYGLLKDYCFLIKNGSSLYLNFPYQPDNNSPLSFSLLLFNSLTEKINKSYPIFYRPNIFVRKANFLNATIVFPISYNIINQSSQIQEYDLDAKKIIRTISLNEINAQKNIIFVKNQTSSEQTKIILGTSYDNQIRVFSGENSQIDFSFGSRYEAEITDAFWINDTDPQLLIFGNTMLYNQIDANFILILPKTSIVP